MWYENPLIASTVPLFIAGVTGLAVAWFSMSKARLVASREQGIIDAALEIARSKTELALREVERIAAEAKLSAALLQSMATEQAKMAAVVQETHALSNSAKTLLDAEIAKERSEKALMRSEMTSQEKLFAAEKGMLIQRNDDLQRQLNTLALSFPAQQAAAALPATPPALAPPPPTPAPIAVILTDESGEVAVPLPVLVTNHPEEKPRGA